MIDKKKWLAQLSESYRFPQTDHVPVACIDAGFSCINAGLTLTETFADPEKSFAAKLRAEEEFEFAPLPQIIRHTILGAHDFGGDVRPPEDPHDQAMKVVSHPVNSEEDARNISLPDPETAGGIETAMRFSMLQHEKGLPVWFHHRSPFTMAANISGMNFFGRWMIKKPELCDHLIGLALDHVFNVLDVWIETFGSNRIAVYNSSPMESNQLISPDHFRRFALPAHIQYHRRLKEAGIRRYFFHVCGDQERNMPLLAEVSRWPHPAIISIGHEVGIRDAASFFPKDIIYGNIDPRIVQSGSPETVFAACREAVTIGSDLPNGFILAPGCDLPTFSPVENVRAMIRAASSG